MIMRKNFTLIELLVVLAIMMILLSLLMPALGKAKESARQISCAGSLRQIGAAAELYGVDFGGYYLPFSGSPFQFNLPSGCPNWWDYQPYWVVALHPYLQNLDLLICPSAPTGSEAIYNLPCTLDGVFQKTPLNYGWNSSSIKDAYCASAEWLKMGQVNKPSSWAMCADSYQNYYIQPSAGVSSWPYEAAYIHRRHSLKLNVLFADSHVDRKKTVIGWDLQYNNPY
jgi:prepilin-type processing-associated H-X9-DG protein